MFINSTEMSENNCSFITIEEKKQRLDLEVSKALEQANWKEKTNPEFVEKLIDTKKLEIDKIANHICNYAEKYINKSYEK